MSYSTADYNRHKDGKIYSLSQRGFLQAQRNNSHQIWTLLASTQESLPHNQSTKNYDDTYYTKIPVESKEIEDRSHQKKEVSFKVSKNEGDPQNEKLLENVREQDKKSKKLQDGKLKNEGVRVKDVVVNDQVQGLMKKIKRKSVQKYIKDQVPFTPFRKFYNRPCPEAYGRKNTSQRGVFYGNFMKTHNIQPHTLDNKPQNYQTYISALNHGKRTKLDLQDRWTRIQRQLSKNLDYRQLVNLKATAQVLINETNVKKVLKNNINASDQKLIRAFPQRVDKKMLSQSKSLGKLETRATLALTGGNRQGNQGLAKRSKSAEKELYYIYKYSDKDQKYNCTRYARDRHGITCFVDPAFRENDVAYTNFLKKVNSIEPQKCRRQDINIDAQRVQNYKMSKQEVFSKHYLIPNVDIPYNSSNYSRKRTHSLAQTTS